MNDPDEEIYIEPSPRQAAGNLHRKGEYRFPVRSLTPPQAAGNALAVAVQEIESGGSDQASLNWMMAFLCFVGIGVFFYFGEVEFNFDFNSPDFNPLIIIPGALAFGGIVSLVKAAKGTLRHRKFGRVRFKMSGDSYIGGNLCGSIVTPTEVVPSGDWDISLQVIETISYTSSGKSTKYKDKVRLELKQKVARHTCSSRTGIPVDIQIPESSRQTIKGIKGPYRWVLAISAPFDTGVDFSYSFGVRVHPHEIE